jgi:hypothetical protein
LLVVSCFLPLAFCCLPPPTLFSPTCFHLCPLHCVPTPLLCHRGRAHAHAGPPR